jgi:hypothetical protein
MAKVKVIVTTCDRHGGEIPNSESFVHFEVTVGGKTRGRRPHRTFDFCEKCMADFLKFLDGDAIKSVPTVNQRIADGNI